MSHIADNDEHDFDDLEKSNLPPDVIKSVKQARREARSIIDSLEPAHITSWIDLIARLENALSKAKQSAELEKFFREALPRAHAAQQPLR